MAGEDQHEHDPLVGTVFADRYLITGRLGKGGMAVVYRATDRNLNRDVAVKVLRKDVAADPVAAKRLVREARAAASLHHPHIITILDVGERNGTVYVVMELLTGRSLADVLEQDGAMPLERALPVAEQLASALVVAHSQGIIHRDIKPENLYLIEHGGTGDFLKVLDFSIAKLPTEMVTAALTRAGSVFGTPHYMAPEQVEGKNVGPQTDLYAAGAVLYEMLTGDPPFDGPSVIDILLKHVKSPPPVLSVPGVRLPAGLAELVTRLLAKKVGDRPASASILRDELAKIIAEMPRDGEGGQDSPSHAGLAATPVAGGPSAAPLSAVMDFLPPALPSSAVHSGAGHAGAAGPASPSKPAAPARGSDAAHLAVDLARNHGAIAGKATVADLPEAADLPDLPDALPAESGPHAAPETKRKFAGFGDPDAPEQRTMVGAGVGNIVREMARQRSDGSGAPMAMPHAPVLQPPPPPPSHPAPLPPEPGLKAPGSISAGPASGIGISAPTAVQVIPQAVGDSGAFDKRAAGSGSAERPGAAKAGASAADKPAPVASTAVHRNRGISGANPAADQGRAQTEPMGSIGGGTGRPASGKAPPPPPSSLAGHTRRPPPRPHLDDRQPTQPSLPGDAAALVRQKRHQQDTVLPAPAPAAPPPSASKKGLWIGLAIGGVVVLAVVAWLAFGQ
jgi:serine/threonine-protein kinase